MRKYSYLCVAAALAVVITGCAENQTKIGEGAGMGGLLGATVGGIVGHQSGNGVAGALIGGAAGAAGGAMVGSQITKNPPPGYADSTGAISQVTMGQIVDWTKQGLTGDEIISRIRTTHSTYALTMDDIHYLRTQGVSQRVIEAMQGAR